MTPVVRPLTGCVANLSISESDDSVSRGFPLWQVNRVTVQIVAALFGQGASLVFGHDWREDGVMEAVYGFARQMQSPLPLSPAEVEAENNTVLRNLLPWPDSPRLSQLDLERLSSTLRVESAGLPLELRPYGDEAARAGPKSLLYSYVRARGLTFLRHRLNEACHARVCVGGRRSGFAGRYPGVIEEAVLALRAHKPLYVASFLGGAAEQIVDAIEGKVMPVDFATPNSLQRIYQDPPVNEHDPATRSDRTIEPADAWNELATTGQDMLAGGNGLSINENRELLRTRVVDRAIELVLIGLSRVYARGH